MNILEVHNVSIRYITGDFKDIGLKEYVIRRLTGDYHVNEFWADRNISFNIKKGEMLGIIGTNGAGKSTLLKAVSGIMEPTEGYIRRQGKVAALLELGSGFDGDLTVSENIYLRGALLGYSKSFLDSTYKQIIDFSGLEEFENRPFKQLSSGMKSRLAFSIASLLEPDLLIVDEVLSVGDGAFRQKSAAKMKEIINGGATTILVSHSLSQVRSMCNKILWLHKGRQIAFGSQVNEICDAYAAMLNQEKPVSPETLLAANGAPNFRITKQPQSVTAEVGSKAEFSIEAEGNFLFYQWEWFNEKRHIWESFKNAAYRGLTSATMTVPAARNRNGLQFRCRVVGLYGSVCSDPVTLTVADPASK